MPERDQYRGGGGMRIDHCDSRVTGGEEEAAGLPDGRGRTEDVRHHVARAQHHHRDALAAQVLLDAPVLVEEDHRGVGPCLHRGQHDHLPDARGRCRVDRVRPLLHLPGVVRTEEEHPLDTVECPPDRGRLDEVAVRQLGLTAENSGRTIKVKVTDEGADRNDRLTQLRGRPSNRRSLPRPSPAQSPSSLNPRGRPMHKPKVS